MSEQVHIRVGEGRKEKWGGHATEDHADKYGSVSTLIRHAVERQIEIDSGDGSAPASAVAQSEPNGRIDDIKVGVEDNGYALEAIQERLERIHEDLTTTAMPEPELVFSEVYGQLPTVEPGFEEAEADSIAKQFGVTAGEVAEKVDMSEDEVGRALTQLQYEYDDVQMLMTREFDAPQYWLED